MFEISNNQQRFLRSIKIVDLVSTFLNDTVPLTAPLPKKRVLLRHMVLCRQVDSLTEQYMHLNKANEMKLAKQLPLLFLATQILHGYTRIVNSPCDVHFYEWDMYCN